ncbi:MAG: hypothetical protein IPM33_05785 [Phycisphaerales bacterium]|nr:hypothetical protein [Phycisphaerales bacterium]
MTSRGATNVRVVSIGAMGANAMWGEREPARTGHATTTFIGVGDRKILVDPGLPAPALVARLGERLRLTPADITDVFLTSFQPETRRSLEAFEGATWWISTEEREGVGAPMAAELARLARLNRPEDAELLAMLQKDVALLRRCDAAPDALAPGVDLFPLPGVTPGLCGLVVEGPRHTVLICGDAIPTQDHLESGRIQPGAADIDKARASLEDALEVADLMVLGRDNIVVNPAARPF